MVEPATIKLSDDRTLAYAGYGARDGLPLVLFHGAPGSHIQAQVLDQHAHRIGLPLIVPTRPGYGRSDPKPGRQIVDSVDDAVELTDALGVQRFGAVGVSAGGPYALGAASRVPGRLLCVAVLSGAGLPTAEELAYPYDRDTEKEQHRPFAERAVNDTEALADEFIAAAQEYDRPAIESHRGWLVATLREAYRQGMDGIADDHEARIRRPWGFDVGAIDAPVHLWHGDRDTAVSIAAAQDLAARLPDAHLVTLEGHGHYLPDTVFLSIFTALRDVMARAVEA